MRSNTQKIVKAFSFLVALTLIYSASAPPLQTLILSLLLCCTLIALLAYLYAHRRPVLLVDYSCFLPESDRKCSYEVCEYLVRRTRRFSEASENFMRGIYLKSGLGNETYAPPLIFQPDIHANRMVSAVKEAKEGMIDAVDSLLTKTNIKSSSIDILIVTCGMFSPAPSLTSILIHHYGLRESTKTYNLSGMGCSSGVAAVDLAARILSSSRRIQLALIVVTESIGQNWYFGDERSMLVTNCIFRVGTSAVLLSNDHSRRSASKMELTHALRTHCGADDAAYRAAFQEEDENGNVGMALKKDLVRVAGDGLSTHIRLLAPKVLPWSQLMKYIYTTVLSNWWRKLLCLKYNKTVKNKQFVPDFGTAFEHVCVHTGGKAVIEAVSRVMRFGDLVTEPSRMTLHRFGNTSSSLVFYELAYFEGKERVKRGDRLWMLSFGTGFKVCSLVWRALKDSEMRRDNPWRDCIHLYPIKSW